MERRLSKRERVVLQLLAAHGESYGLDLVKRSEGLLKRGRVYVHLLALLDDGLIASRATGELDPWGYQRKIFRLTEAGRSLALDRVH